MPKLTASSDFSNFKTVDEVNRYVTQFAKNVVDVINGNIDFNDNIKTSQITAVFASGGVNTGFQHSLGRLPRGYIQAGSSTSGTIYDGTLPNTDSLIYLQASSAGTYNILIF